ncbi:MAG: hypothetical protein OHK0021_19220 [Bryobacter sp.]
MSEEELERFRTLAEKKGARSLSDLAREAMERMDVTHRHALVDTAHVEFVPALFAQIDKLQDTVNELNMRIQEISARRPVGSETLVLEENESK